MKTFIVNKIEDTRVPFLRGILTRALLDAGMSFDAAFELATTVRRELAEREEISSTDLRAMVVAKIKEYGDDDVLESFSHPVSGPTRIVVHSESGSSSAFSRGSHVRHLLSSGIATTDAEDITGKIFDQLLSQGAESISSLRLGYLTYKCIQQEIGDKAANRFLVWTQFERGDTPLLLLLGGTVGTGKSSIATQIAHRLEIVRTQSTDMLREVMRMMIPERLVPVLHASSFEAWSRLPIQDKKDSDPDSLIAGGFRSQAELLSGPCEAVLQRAERESVSMILEGVHALPELVDRTVEASGAIAVHVTLAVLRSSELKARLRGRSTREPKRRAQRYLKNFDAIWRLQSILLSEADRYNATIINNDDIEKAVQKIVNKVNEELAKRFDGKARDVFGDAVSRAKALGKSDHWQQLIPALINI